MKELSADPATRDPLPWLGREERHDTASAAYDRLTATDRLAAHHDTVPQVRSLSPPARPGMEGSLVWEGPPTQAQYVALVVDELDSYDPAFQRWVRKRLPASAG